MDQNVRWLTVSDACGRAQCGKKTIYTAVRTGKLTAAKANARGDLRFDPAWIDQWLNSQIFRKHAA
jgi:excisionase family DNA binding protein